MAEKSNYVERYFQYMESLTNQLPGMLDGDIQFIDGKKLIKAHFLSFTPGLPALISFSDENPGLEHLQKSLRINYPSELELYILPVPLPERLQTWTVCKVAELHLFNETIEAVFLPACARGGSLEEFMEVIAHLRAPDGCPWDRKQTHDSLRPYLLEETYEALEALDRKDLTELKEELGDILLQIALHSQIGEENQTFTISDVIAGITNKIISRHPHVFGEVKVKDERDVVQNWEKLKEIERAENGREEIKGLLDGIPSTLPALSQAQVIQERAARVGFDWPEIAPVIGKVLEEWQEVKDAPTEAERALELGDLLFAVVNLVRWYKVDAESALRQTNQKFRRRFNYLEEQSRASGRELQKMTLEEMDALWDEAKGLEAS